MSIGLLQVARAATRLRDASVLAEQDRLAEANEALGKLRAEFRPPATGGGFALATRLAILQRFADVAERLGRCDEARAACGEWLAFWAEARLAAPTLRGDDVQARHEAWVRALLARLGPAVSSAE